MPLQTIKSSTLPIYAILGSHRLVTLLVPSVFNPPHALTIGDFVDPFGKKLAVRILEVNELPP
jgi:hypothetical protein